MLHARLSLVATLVVLTSACGASQPSIAQQRTVAAPALEHLRVAQFEKAEASATERIKQGEQSAWLYATRAIARTRLTLKQLVTDALSIASGAFVSGVNQQYLTFAADNADKGFAAIDADLAEVAKEPNFTLDLCLACWEVDWNRSGEVDERDRRLFAVEVDKDGNRLEDGDPRMRPTFRFDAGDVYWLRTFLGFGRAALQLITAFDFSEVPRLMMSNPDNIRIPLVSKERFANAKKLLSQALEYSEKTRQMYLAERDDHQEWFPNPRQRNHPVPYPVDQALYDTWKGVIEDVQGLLAGRTGVSVAELAQLGDKQWQQAPKGFIDLERLLRDPADIVFDAGALDDVERSVSDLNGARWDLERAQSQTESKDANAGGTVLDVSTAQANVREKETAAAKAIEDYLRETFGSAYRSEMAPTPLLSRLERMKNEADRGVESFESKLRYLLWIN